jgi:hypothetical protein
MIFLFLLVGLLFLVSGGIGLFYTNTNLVSGTTLWFFGNLTFSTFVIFGVLVLIFMAVFNAEFD